jgi:hypothetical protein
MADAKYEIDQMQKLMGGKIVGPIHDGDDPTNPETFFGFQVVVAQKRTRANPQAKTTKYNVWVSRDDEGNGPGHLEIEAAQ